MAKLAKYSINHKDKKNTKLYYDWQIELNLYLSSCLCGFINSKEQLLFSLLYDVFLFV